MVGEPGQGWGVAMGLLRGEPEAIVEAAVLDALVEGGAGVIELGMPFTDPMADGPAIQAANIRAAVTK